MLIAEIAIGISNYKKTGDPLPLLQQRRALALDPLADVGKPLRQRGHLAIHRRSTQPLLALGTLICWQTRSTRKIPLPDFHDSSKK